MAVLRTNKVVTEQTLCKVKLILTQQRERNWLCKRFVCWLLVDPYANHELCLFKKYFPIDYLVLFVCLDVKKHPALLCFKMKLLFLEWNQLSLTIQENSGVAGAEHDHI